MSDPVVDTISYYDRHAAKFAAQTADLDLDQRWSDFPGHCFGFLKWIVPPSPFADRHSLAG